MRLLALRELAPLTRDRDNHGRWVVDALHSWGRTVTHAREPSFAGGEHLMHPSDLAGLKLGDCDDLLRAQVAFAQSLGLPVAALVWLWDSDGTGHVSTIVGAHSYAHTPLWVIDPQLDRPTPVADFTIRGRFRGQADSFEVVR